MPLHENTTILNGKYRLLRPIGEGGMARVWLAEELTFGNRQVAIKEPHAGLGTTNSEELRQRFLCEVKVSVALAKATSFDNLLLTDLANHGFARMRIVP